MEKRLFVQLNGNRKVMGILRGYDVSRRGTTLHLYPPPSSHLHRSPAMDTNDWAHRSS